MIVLFTDFGWNGPYVGQMKAQMFERVSIPVVDLLHDVPPFDFQRASYLLASYASAFPLDTIFVAVVDPGVGTIQREPVIVEAGGRWFIGPGNGLFDQVIRQAENYRAWRIVWRPPQLSATFHGRDLFAPVAAMLASGIPVENLAEPLSWSFQQWPEDLAEVIYIDPFGNGLTGLRASSHRHLQRLLIGDMTVSRHTTFADVNPGSPFFYANANGMLEVAVNQGRADQLLRLHIGAKLILS